MKFSFPVYEGGYIVLSGFLDDARFYTIIVLVWLFGMNFFGLYEYLSFHYSFSVGLVEEFGFLPIGILAFVMYFIFMPKQFNEVKWKKIKISLFLTYVILTLVLFFIFTIPYVGKYS